VTLQIRIKLPLGNNAFEIVAAGQPEQRFTIVLDVIAVEEPITLVANDRSQSPLPVNQWRVSQVFSLAPQKVKGNEAGVATVKQQITKLRLPIFAEAHDLAIQNR
jgi:hypothetical protein